MSHSDVLTPDPPPSNQGIGVNNGDFGFPTQSAAGEFTTSQAFDITSLSAYVDVFSASDPPMTLTDTFHLGLAAGPTNPQGATFTTLFSLPVSFTTNLTSAGSSGPGWATTSVPSYLLPAGTYWIVVSATASDSPFALGLPGGAPNPLSGYAFMTPESDGWQTLSEFPGGQPASLGFQVEGAPVAAVPLPGALGLMLIGMGTLSIGFAELRKRA